MNLRESARGKRKNTTIIASPPSFRSLSLAGLIFRRNLLLLKFGHKMASQRRTAILSFLLLLVLAKFGVSAERVSLRIGKDNTHSQQQQLHCSAASAFRIFVIEHLRPFDGPLIRQAIDVLSVDECARKCAELSECAGANFLQNLRGDPICTLHSSASQQGESAAAPLASMFGISQICGASSAPVQQPCARPWAFQKFPRIGPIDEKFLLTSNNLSESPVSLSTCLMECQNNRDCASALYSDSQQKCRLARISPQNVHGLRRYFQQEPHWDLFESNCSPKQIDPSNCGFSRINQAGFVEPFSALLLQIRSPAECQKACLATLLSTRSSICRSWTYDSATGRCYLSHLALRGLGRRVLEQMGPSLSSGELDECMSFRLDCRPSSLLLVGHSPLKLFRGHVRSKRAKGCERPVEETHQFSVQLPFGECGFEKRADHSHWGTLLVKEGSTELITSRDKLVQANCRLHRKFVDELLNDEQSSLLPASLKVRLRVNGSEEQQPQQSVSTRVVVLPPARERAQHVSRPAVGPQYRLEVLDANGRPASRVEMGEDGFLEIRRVDSSLSSRAWHHKMLLADLRAVDSADSGKWLQLIDENGCVTKPEIVHSIQQTDPNRLRIGIRFSGFEDKAHVSYQGLVKRCQFGCALECNRKFIRVGQSVEGEKQSEEDRNEPIRLHRRAIPSTNGQNRHFQLEADLFEVQSRPALFRARPLATAGEFKQIDAAAGHAPVQTTLSAIGQLLACLQEPVCICNILLIAVQAPLLLLAIYLLLWHLRLWLRSLQWQSLLLLRHFYAKLVTFTTVLNGQWEEEEEGPAETDQLPQQEEVEDARPSGRRAEKLTALVRASR